MIRNQFELPNIKNSNPDIFIVFLLFILFIRLVVYRTVFTVNSKTNFWLYLKYNIEIRFCQLNCTYRNYIQRYIVWFPMHLHKNGSISFKTKKIIIQFHRSLSLFEVNQKQFPHVGMLRVSISILVLWRFNIQVTSNYTCLFVTTWT